MTSTLLQQAVETLTGWLAAHDPEGFGCACVPDRHKCGPCTAYDDQKPLHAAIAALESALQQQPEPVADMNLNLVWNTLMFFALPSNYVLGERIGGVLQGCPRKPPPSPDEMAGYARRGLEAVRLYLGQEPEDWLRNGTAPPALQQQEEPGEVATLPVPPKITAIIERLHTQDNRITSHPLFAVQQKRIIAGLDSEYADQFAWVDYEGECSPEDSNLYDAKRENGEPLPDGVRRVGFIEKWEFVTGCMTEQGCKDFIACNGHNLKEPRIYAYSGYRNAEFIALREWLMSLRTASPSPQATQQAMPPEVAEQFVFFKKLAADPAYYRNRLGKLLAWIESPSPQDFTLPMLEEGKGADGVGGTDGR